MGKIDEDTITKCTEAANIVEVVSDLLEWYDPISHPGGLKKKGVRYTAICPFHEDRHMGNFIVYPKGNCFKCFVCEAKGGSVEFLMKYKGLTFPDAIRWLGKKYHIPVDDVPVDYTPPPPRELPPPLPTLALPMAIVRDRMKFGDGTLVTWLRSLPWDGAQRKRLDEVLTEYYVGHSKKGHVIWWQIDENYYVRTGKMMKYYPEGHPKFGHRDKESNYNFDWIHAALSRHWDDEKKEYTYDPPYPYPDIFDPDKEECRPTLFGMHLLNKYPNADVRIVESEKTAVFMATAYGNHSGQVWMACGGAENISREKLEPIMKRHRRIVLFPDRDAVDKWRAKAENLHYDRVCVNVEAVTKWWKPDDGEKADIADVVLRMLMEHAKKPAVTAGDVMKKNPAVRRLVEQLNLEEVR